MIFLEFCLDYISDLNKNIGIPKNAGNVRNSKNNHYQSSESDSGSKEFVK
jgi:hypothetical protein